MDKETLSNYGWIVILVLILAVMLAIATPFGNFIAGAIKATTAGFFSVNQNAMTAGGITIPGQSFEDNGEGNTPKPAPVVGSATFNDGVTLTWEELKFEESGLKYDYHAFLISETEVGMGAFTGCKNLTSITIPDGVTSIGDSAFATCSNLTSITIPDSVTSIGDSAFSMTSLKSITIPDSVTSIGYSMFYHCLSLTSATIGDSVTTIGKDAFLMCNKLESVVIGDSVTSIGDSAFAGCAKLNSINYAGTQAQWKAITKGNEWKNSVPMMGYLYCSDGKLYIIMA